MAAHRKRPTPPARMVELLAREKRTVSPIVGWDDPLVAARARRVDRRRVELRSAIAQARIDREGSVNGSRAIHDERIREMQGHVRDLDAEFAALLEHLPRMRVFEEAWERCWAVLVTERGFPHATEHRRAWRAAMTEAMKPEARACFLDEPTAFNHYMSLLLTQVDGALAGSVTIGQLVA